MLRLPNRAATRSFNLQGSERIQMVPKQQALSVRVAFEGLVGGPEKLGDVVRIEVRPPA